MSERAGVALVLEPEAVSELEHAELLGDQTGERGAHHRARQGLLGDTTRPQVNVIRVPAGQRGHVRSDAVASLVARLRRSYREGLS